jgi:hypothetical protein
MVSVRRLMAFVDRNRKSRRAISTIMANLMMLIIVVTLCSMLFIWATSSLGGYQNGAASWFSSRSIANQERPSVETVYFSYAPTSGPCAGYSYCATIYIRNVGTIPFIVSSIYINSTLYTQSSSTTLISQVSSYTFPLIGQSLVHGDVQTVTVATQRGTVVATTWVS